MDDARTVYPNRISSTPPRLAKANRVLSLNRIRDAPAGQAKPKKPKGDQKHCNVQWTFQTLLRHNGIQPRSRKCRPRIHDMRHTFAVTALLDAYRGGLDIDRRLILLATYLGHVSPAGTYWYLSATPQLLTAALDRVDRNRGEGQ
jgi:integrase